MGERYAPDVAYISAEKQAVLPYNQGYNPNPPELAVEVVSPTDNPQHLRVKLANYLVAHVLVWIVYPQRHEVEVYLGGQAVRIIGYEGTLDGGDVLPGFTLTVKDIFPPANHE